MYDYYIKFWDVGQLPKAVMLHKRGGTKITWSECSLIKDKAMCNKKSFVNISFLCHIKDTTKIHIKFMIRNELLPY